MSDINKQAAPWAKVFEVDGTTVLFFLEPDGDDMILHQVTNADDIFMDLKLTFTNDLSDKSRKAFDMLNEKSAIGALKLRSDMLADPAEAENGIAAVLDAAAE